MSASVRRLEISEDALEEDWMLEYQSLYQNVTVTDISEGDYHLILGYFSRT